MEKLNEIIEMLEGAMMMEMKSKGVAGIDLKEMMYVADIIKDLTNAKYWNVVIEAMGKSTPSEIKLMAQ